MSRIGVVWFLWTVDLNDESLPAVAMSAAASQADVLEIAYMPGCGLDADRAAEALGQAGIEASVLTILPPEADTSSEDAGVRAASIAHLQAATDFAAGVCSPVVMGPLQRALNSASITAPDVRDGHLRRSVETLKEVGAYAARQGVALAIEPLNRFEIDLVNTVADGVAVCESIGLDNVGLGLDVVHLNIEEHDPAAALRAAGGHLRHLHAPDNDRGVPGTGHAPWAELAVAARESGFDGIVTFESWTGDLEAGWRMWRPYFPDADAAARDAVTFLRAQFA